MSRNLLTLLVIVVATTIAISSALPPPLPNKSPPPSLIRSKIITKHDLLAANHNRQQKSHKLPPPFVVTTQLHVKDPVVEDDTTGGGGRKRKSRTWKDNDGATVVEGLRVPDDETDRVTWRNGRVINNVFVPNDGSGQKATARREGRDYKYHAGSTNAGRPVYYVVEEPDSLHSDHSPYTYEPADTQTSLVSDYTQQGLAQQGPGDFVIKEHTYSMCPGCPTFSIPVPIPKEHQQQHKQDLSPSPSHQQFNYDIPPHQLEAAKNLSFLEKVGHSLQDLQFKALKLLDPVVRAKDRVLGLDTHANKEDGINEKFDHNVGEGQIQEKESTGTSPLAIAGMAAFAVGGMALVSSALTLSRVSSVNNVDGQRASRSLLQQNPALLEYARRNYEMFAELSWDQECIFDALCKEAAETKEEEGSKGEKKEEVDFDVKDADAAADAAAEAAAKKAASDPEAAEAVMLMNRLVRQTCRNRKKSEIPETQRCKMLRNEYRRTRNHRNIDS